MKAKIKSGNKHNFDIIFERLISVATVEEDKKISFHSFEFFQLEWMLHSIIDFGDSISFEIKNKILANSIRQIIISKKLDKNYFIELINDQIHTHLSQKEKNYILLVSLSVKNLPFRKIRIGSSQIKIHGKNFPKKFRNSRRASFELRNFKKENRDYTKVSISIKSKDFRDAFEHAIKDFEVFRSFLCLILNNGIEIRFEERSKKPINKILQGEIMTLHYEDGTAVDANHFWFVPDFEDAKVIDLQGEKRERLKRDLVWLIKSYNKCKIGHQRTIKKALNLYVSAYDEKNKHICFLKAWSALETLVNTDENEILIKRCLSIYAPNTKQFNKQVLESLRQFRNEYVHKGDNGLDPLIACFNVQDIITNLIARFNLRYSGFFNNITEANLFLDNNIPDLKELQSRKKIIDKIIKQKNKNTNR